MNTRDAVIVALLCSDDHDMDQMSVYLSSKGILDKVRAGVEHDGDCTNKCHTCFVCLIEDTGTRADAFLRAMPDGIVALKTD